MYKFQGFPFVYSVLAVYLDESDFSELYEKYQHKCIFDVNNGLNPEKYSFVMLLFITSVLIRFIFEKSYYLLHNL